MLGLGQVPVTIQEAHAAKVALQALELRGYAGIGQLSPDELFFESQRQGAFQATAFPGVPSLEGILAAALAADPGLGRKSKRKGFFGGITKFAGPALSLVTKNAGILTAAAGVIPGGATVVGPAIKALDSPQVKKLVAKAVVSTRTLENAGAPVSAGQRSQAKVFETAILQTPGGGAALAEARVDLYGKAQAFGQEETFARLSKPPVRPCGFFGRLFRRC
jgi:hypothetical protein